MVLAETRSAISKSMRRLHQMTQVFQLVDWKARTDMHYMIGDWIDEFIDDEFQLRTAH